MPKRKSESLPAILQNKKGEFYCNWNRNRYYLGRSAEIAKEKLLKLLTEGITPEKCQKKVKISKKISTKELTLLELVEKFMDAWKEHSHFSKVRTIAKMILPLYGTSPAREFGPKCLTDCRSRWVDENLTRNYINKLVGWIVRMFRWGVTEELVPLETVQKLEMVEPLGDGKARDSEEREDVSDMDVLKTLPFLSETVRDMVILQRISGMRPSELFRMTLEQFVQRDENSWVYVPFKHKTKAHKKGRVIAFGKFEIQILKKYANRKPDEPFFLNQIGNPFTRYVYNDAVKKAIRKANAQGHDVPHWTPYQLRHAAATFISLLMDENAAAIALGHASTKMTRIYDHSAVQKACDMVARRDALAGEKLEKLFQWNSSELKK